VCDLAGGEQRTLATVRAPPLNIPRPGD
jgi:hypothetical protein